MAQVVEITKRSDIEKILKDETYASTLPVETLREIAKKSIRAYKLGFGVTCIVVYNIYAQMRGRWQEWGYKSFGDWGKSELQVSESYLYEFLKFYKHFVLNRPEGVSYEEAVQKLMRMTFREALVQRTVDTSGEVPKFVNVRIEGEQNIEILERAKEKADAELQGAIKKKADLIVHLAKNYIERPPAATVSDVKVSGVSQADMNLILNKIRNWARHLALRDVGDMNKAKNIEHRYVKQALDLLIPEKPQKHYKEGQNRGEWVSLLAKVITNMQKLMFGETEFYVVLYDRSGRRVFSTPGVKALDQVMLEENTF